MKALKNGYFFSAFNMLIELIGLIFNCILHLTRQNHDSKSESGYSPFLWSSANFATTPGRSSAYVTPNQ